MILFQLFLFFFSRLSSGEKVSRSPNRPSGERKTKGEKAKGHKSGEGKKAESKVNDPSPSDDNAGFFIPKQEGPKVYSEKKNENTVKKTRALKDDKMHEDIKENWTTHL